LVLRFDVIKGCPNPGAIKLSNSKLGLRLNNYRPTIEIKKSEMITIPKKILALFVLVTFIIAIFHTMMLYDSFNSEMIFQSTENIFLSLSIYGILTNVYLKSNEYHFFDRILKNKNTIVGTLSLWFIILGIFFSQLVKFGWLNGRSLYFQLATILLGLTSIITYLQMHLNIFKNKR
jgi:protein-S-isoprenylcysteine O-methyltransferase Ste14